MTAPVSISVVVCAYTLDRLEQLTAAITSARTQLHDSDDLIVVIDHNDELFEQITPLVSEQLRVVPNDHAQGLSGARNTGVAASTFSSTTTRSVVAAHSRRFDRGSKHRTCMQSVGPSTQRGRAERHHHGSLRSSGG